MKLHELYDKLKRMEELKTIPYGRMLDREVDELSALENIELINQEPEIEKEPFKACKVPGCNKQAPKLGVKCLKHRK